MKTRVGISIPFYQRHDLTRLTVAWNRARFEEAGCEVVIVLTGSDGKKSEQLAKQLGCQYLEHENHPLGAKFNAGIAALRGEDLDFVVWIGSDDFLSQAYVDFVVKKMEEGYDCVSNKSCYFHHAGYDKIYYARFACGVGAAISVGHLNTRKWRTFDVDSDTVLDLSFKQMIWQDCATLVRELQPASPHRFSTSRPTSVLYSLRRMKRLTKLSPEPAKPFMALHFPGVLSKLKPKAGTVTGAKSS